MSLYLQYGSFSHNEGECTIAISKVGNYGERRTITETWSVSGTLFGSSSSDLTSQANDIIDAYSTDGLDLVWSGTGHSLISNDSIYGTRVIGPPSFEKGDGAEFATQRSYRLSVSAEFADSIPGLSPDISYSESVSFTGNGGPLFVTLVPIYGDPIRQQISTSSPIVCHQSGRRTILDNWPSASPPIYLSYLENQAESIRREIPERGSRERTVIWDYTFVIPSPAALYRTTPHIF